MNAKQSLQETGSRSKEAGREPAATANEAGDAEGEPAAGLPPWLLSPAPCSTTFTSFGLGKCCVLSPSKTEDKLGTEVLRPRGSLTDLSGRRWPRTTST